MFVNEIVCFANDNDAFIPEQWAMEGLMQLEELMVVAKLVHRDFEPYVAKFGDVVNTRKPGEFKIRRKKDGDTLAHQDAVSTNVPVKLDQWFYNSFVIYDGEESKSFADLVTQYLVPSMRVIARGADRAILGRAHALLENRVGKLGKIAAGTAAGYVLDARETLNSNLAPVDEARALLLASTSETAMLKTDMFIKANERGDGGAALENARLGRIYGFDTFLAQNVASVRGGDTVAGTITNAAAVGKTGSQPCTITGYPVVLGEYAVVEGDNQPNVITAATSVADTTAVTLAGANKFATEALAPITVYKACAAKGDYVAGHIGVVVLDGYTATKGPKIGQLLAFGTGTGRHVYTIIEAEENAAGTEMSVYLDRPLAANVADKAAAFPGPAGDYNLALHRECLALVTRPLALPRAGSGALAGVAVYNDIPMRVTMQYDIDAGGTKVNCDMLAGIAVLDAKLGVVLLG